MFGKKQLKSPDADKVKALKKWDARDKKRQLLIHTVSANYVNTPLLMKPAEMFLKPGILFQVHSLIWITCWPVSGWGPDSRSDRNQDYFSKQALFSMYRCKI